MSGLPTNTLNTCTYGREVYFVNGADCFLLQSADGLVTSKTLAQDLCSNQEEADTRIILHVLHILKQEPSVDSITVRCSDTDVLVLLMYYCIDVSVPVYFDTGHGNHRRLISINEAIAFHGVELCKALPGLHAFTGSDTTSAMISKGKIRTLKKLLKHLKYLLTFQNYGKEERPSPEVIIESEAFTCIVFGREKCKLVSDARYELFMKKFKANKFFLSSFEGTDMFYLPPCQAALNLHILRANYQAFVWKHAHIAFVELPPIQTSGWTLIDNRLSILWNDGPIVPEDLASISKDPQPKTSTPIGDGDPLEEAEEEADPDDDFEFEDDGEVIDSDDDSDDEDWNDGIDESDTDDDE